jgi:CRP-like cAMP-binding protein
MDVIGNDIANVNTTGYKQSDVTFKEQLVNTIRPPSESTAGLQVGMGVQLGNIARNFSDGILMETQRASNVAVTGEGFFVVYDGKVDVVRERADGNKAVVNHLSAGDFFGEMALLDDGPRTATCVAVEATKCYVLPRWDFMAVLKEDPDMAITILEEMARRFRAALDVL